MLHKAGLEQRHKSKNPFKAFANYRAARMFLAASKSLYNETKVTTPVIGNDSRDGFFFPESI